MYILHLLKCNKKLVWGGGRRLGFAVWLLLFRQIIAFSLHMLLVSLFLFNLYCTWVAAWASESRSLAGWYKPSWISTSAFSIHKWGKESALSPFPVTAFTSKPWKKLKYYIFINVKKAGQNTSCLLWYPTPQLYLYFLTSKFNIVLQEQVVYGIWILQSSKGIELASRYYLN